MKRLLAQPYWLLALIPLFFIFQNCGSQDTSTYDGEEIPSGTYPPQVYNNLTFGSYPHKVDVILPPNKDQNTRAIVMIHGGGGNKENFAFSLGFRKTEAGTYSLDPDSANGYLEDFLIQHNVALIFAQGQAIPQKPDSFTWSNLIMTSGQNDVAFLQLLAEELRGSKWGFSKVYLAGHSMGGAMTNRMWCQSPNSFDGFGSIAGPLSVQLFGTCNPSVKKPYIHITGLNDRIIQIVEDRAVGADINHANDATLTLDSTTRLIGGVAFIHPAPEFQNELTSYGWRSNLMCSEVASAKVQTPNNINWATLTQENCSGRLKMIQVRYADHCTGGQGGDHYKCDIPLTPVGTTDTLDRLVDFFADN